MRGKKSNAEPFGEGNPKCLRKIRFHVGREGITVGKEAQHQNETPLQGFHQWGPAQKRKREPFY